MSDTEEWRPMSGAPKNGKRILVTVRPAEQGPAEVDVAFWAKADQSGDEGWRAADSHPGCVIAYAEAELKCWMPLPGANSGGAVSPPQPDPWQGDAIEESGSGI